MTSESKSVQKRVAIQRAKRKDSDEREPEVVARIVRGPGGELKAVTAKKRVFRFYEDEYLAWQQRAKRQKVSLTEWIRQACRQQLG